MIGFDIDDEKVSTLTAGDDPTDDVGDDAVEASDVTFTADGRAIGEAEYVIVAVPTPVDDLKNPNLTYVERAGEMIGEHIRPGTTVVLESTVYPGATREILAPAIERTSGLDCGEEFFVGYSPERLVPGDDEHGLSDVVKIVSGQTDEVLDDLAALYETVVDAQVHRAPEIEVAEAAKCVENIQRDVNIAVVNELAIACDKLGLNTHDVLRAAGTKWNFHPYRPGLVGGHCIPVDPFFMIYESERNGFSPKLIQQAREINEYMPKHVGELTIRGLNDCGKVIRDSTVLILGLAYKPNVADIRTSAVNGVIEKLQSYDASVVGYDPHADDDAIRAEFGIEVQESLDFAGVDAVVLATPHDEFLGIEFAEVADEMADCPLLVDVMGRAKKSDVESDAIEYRGV